MFQPAPRFDSNDKKMLVSTCYKALKRAGLSGYKALELGAKMIPLRERLSQAIKLREDYGGKGLISSLSQCDNTLDSLIYAIDRSVNFQIPFFSRDSAAPAWIRKDILSETKIVSLVLEEVDSLPRPRTFKEAFSIAQDERVVGFRKYIKELQERITTGDLEGHADLREQIREELNWFRNKSWAGRVAKMIVYAAVPAEIVGSLCGSHVVGISVASLGATCEWLNTIVNKQKAKHWLSMSKCPTFEK